VNLNYPLAFQAAFLKCLRSNFSTASSSPARFRYVQLSGAFCVQDQDKDLWFLSAPRKIKGLAETKMLEFAAEHADRWQTFIVKPGGVMRGGSWYSAIGSMMFGENLAIEDVELGAAMARLAVDGGEFVEEEGVILNKRIIELGREALAFRNT
jgi:hypothetical protein